MLFIQFFFPTVLVATFSALIQEARESQMSPGHISHQKKKSTENKKNRGDWVVL